MLICIIILSDGFPKDPEEFHDLLDEFLRSVFGLPFSKYIELSDTKPKYIKVSISIWLRDQKHV